MRVRNIPNAKKLLEQYQHYHPSPQKYYSKWRNYFDNTNPIHIEIGMGKGKFITTLAERYVDINFIGIEKTEELILKALKRIEIEKMSNIVFIHWNALNLKEILGNGEVQRIYLNFSDPWPKKRHEKRRLTHRNYLKLYRDILEEDGEIHLKTDNINLFEFSIEEMKCENYYIKEIFYDLHKEKIQDNIMTEYEEKFIEEGKIIYKCIAAMK